MNSPSLTRIRLLPALALTLPLLLGACDQIQQKLGLEDPAQKAAKADAEGKAVGGGCRQSGRAIEDCYSLYNWLPKSAMYEGWREMDAYMRENKLDTVKPELPPAPPPEVPGKKKAKKATENSEESKPASEESKH